MTKEQQTTFANPNVAGEGLKKINLFE